MGTRTAVVITCDRRGCYAEYVGLGSEIEGNQRADAQGNHWGQRRTVVKGRIKWIDLCPDHKDEEGR